MLNELELIRLIMAGESQRVDFKRELDLSTAKGKSELVKDIIAFANSAPTGGYLLVGVDDDKSIVGVNAIEEERIQQIAATYINPSVDLHCALVPINFPKQAFIGVIEVKARRRPYKFARSIGSFKQNEVFVRHGSIVLKAAPEDIIEMHGESRVIDIPDIHKKPRRTLMKTASNLSFLATVVLMLFWSVMMSKGEHDLIPGVIAGAVMGVVGGIVLAAAIRAMDWVIQRRQESKTALMAVFWATVILVLGVVLAASLPFSSPADGILSGLVGISLGAIAGAIFVTVIWAIEWIVREVGERLH